MQLKAGRRKAVGDLYDGAGDEMKRLSRFLGRTFLRLVKSGVFLVFLIMLALNVATLTVGFVSNAASAMIQAASGVKTVASAAISTANDAVQALSVKNDELTAAKGEVANERRLAKTALAEADAAKAEALVAKAEAREAKAASMVTFRGEKRSLKEVAEEVSHAVSKRTAKVAATNVGTMAGEGVPLLGIVVIVAATTFEVKQACDTAKDMYDLQVALDPSAAIPGGEKEVCGIRVPTISEIWQMIKDSPMAVWEKTKELLPDVELPDLSPYVDWIISSYEWIGDQFE